MMEPPTRTTIARRRHLFQVVFPSAAVVLGIGVGLLVQWKSPDWKAPDWVSLLYAIALSVGGFYLAGYLSNQTQQLQEATANLELREKVGVIEGHALRSSRPDSDALWSLYVASDVRAALHLYPQAEKTQQDDLLAAIQNAYGSMLRADFATRLTEPEGLCVREGTESMMADLTRVAGSRSHDALASADAFTKGLLASSTTSSLSPTLINSFESFEAYFHPAVRTLLDWTLLAKGNPKIRPLLAANWAQVLAWSTPWYSFEGREKDFQCGIPPVSFARLDADPGCLDVTRRSKIDAIALGLRTHPQAVLVAVYSADDRFIVLDGNHTLAAVVIHRLPNPVLAIVVEGPFDARILPDLANLPLR